MLQMIHVGAYRIPNGVEVFWSHNHVDRDEDYEFLLGWWRAKYGGKPPISRLDVLVPMAWDDERIALHIQRSLERAVARRSIREALADFLN